MSTTFELTIRPRKGWQPIDFREIYLYWELLAFLVWRDVKIRYRQTLLGGLWALLQPFIAMLIFSYIFNRLAHVESDGPPYKLFAYAGLVPWTFFSASVTQSSNSLIANHQLVSKVYFPRVFIPMGAVLALLLDLALSLGLFAAMMVYYRWPVTPAVVWLPVFLLGAILAAAGCGLVLSALNVSFRDVKYAVPFLVQMGLFVTPVIYPVRYVPQRWQVLMGLNPMAGIVIGFRHALLGSPASWQVIGISLAMCLVLFIAGLLIFRRMESRFADII
ncbi:MAG TPA: ABC transporter permease [Terriglobales bacterium]|nr:ABC transporter permease [Terriglobales bacterium]